MNPSEPAKQVTVPLIPAAPEPVRRARGIVGGLYFGLLILAFTPTLWGLARHAAGSQLNSHILLIPFVSAYLIYIERARLPKAYFSSPILGSIAALGGLLALTAARLSGMGVWPLSENDYLAVMTLSLLCFLVAGAFFLLGRKWMAAAAFPVAFLAFMVPMPDPMVHALETASQFASAEATNLFFSISGVPYLRDGLVFQLPNITLRVAQECSGIRSSWVLFITSLVASNLFLTSNWRRTLLVAFIIPLGILRNGFRILVIGLLCTRYGPQMIDTPIHHRGGPIFFALSLIPLFALLWWLRASEARSTRPAVKTQIADSPAT